MAAQQYTNLAESTLAASYTVGDTTLTVHSGDGALFPSAGDFMVGIGSPPTFYLKCTSRSSDVLTISASAQEGTTRANKSSGTVVAQVITAGVLDAIRSDQSQVGALGSLPSSGMKAGDRYQTTDTPYSCIYDGSSWRYFVPGMFPECTVPTTSGWAFHNQSSTTVTTANGGLYFPNTSGVSGYSSYVRSTPGTPYSVKALCRYVGGGFAWCWRNSSNGKLAIFRIGTVSSIIQYNLSFYNSETSYNSDALSWTPFLPGGSTFWLHISDSGSNRSIGTSLDGSDPSSLFSRSNTEFVTPDQFGPCVSNNAVHILSYS